MFRNVLTKVIGDPNRKAIANLTPLVEEVLTTRATADWVELLNARGVPSGAILSLAEALKQPQVMHRGTLQDVEEDGLGRLRLFGLTALFEKTPGGITAAPPRLSADTEAVLGELGISSEAVAALRAKGVV